jgi:hypothetical protein
MSTMNPDIRPEQADEIDALLRAFFRAEMPRTWPAFKAPTAPSAQGSWWARSRSRLALAASVALLVLGSWWLTSRPADYAMPMTGIGAGTGEAGTVRPAPPNKTQPDEKKAREAATPAVPR